MRDSWVAILVAVGIILFGGWVYAVRPDHKYRLTFSFVTPQGVVSASGVMAVYVDNVSVGSIGGGVGMKGDAIFLDLGEGRNVVATLVHGRTASDVDGMSLLAMNAFAAAGRKVPLKDVKRLSGLVPVRGNLIPTLVTFTDLTDPRTARVLDPGDIEANFGKGYRLQSVTLEMLSVGLWPMDYGGVLGEPVTREIEQKLPILITRRNELRRIITDMPPRFQPHFHFFTR